MVSCQSASWADQGFWEDECGGEMIFVCSCQAGRKSLKVRLAKHFPLRREHTIGLERVLGRIQAKLALKKAPSILPKMPHVSLNTLDLSHQRQSSGPTSTALLGPCELDRTIGNAGMGRLHFIGFFPSVVLTICVSNCVNKEK